MYKIQREQNQITALDIKTFSELVLLKGRIYKNGWLKHLKH
jgi:hypothetical protein